MDKNIIKLLIIFSTIVIVIAYVFSLEKGSNISKNSNEISNQKSNEINIVTSFYPIYIMTLNITKNIYGINVSNMSENLKGCIHEYTLSTNDLKKVENANVFIETGENLEPFSNKIKETYPNLKIIDSGKNASNLIKNEEGEINPHIWMSFTNYIDEINEIANELGKIDEKNKEKYLENANIYCKKIEELSEKFKNIKLVKGTKTICLDEGVEYLLKELGMKVTLIETDHENSALSADVVKNTVNYIRTNFVDSIFIEKNSDDKNARMLAKESSRAAVYKIDANMSGDNSIDSYINAMNENYKVLQQIQYTIMN